MLLLSFFFDSTPSDLRSSEAERRTIDRSIQTIAQYKRSLNTNRTAAEAVKSISGLGQFQLRSCTCGMTRPELKSLAFLNLTPLGLGVGNSIDRSARKLARNRLH
ncbi:MAG: hypothetical protein HC895_08420 [Leptolyngbyaceae cyanobacterium SM1_3_5]|nr:hypothetical protein [Leptolyngbyaceae cyanobacterium SM1_3_5]